MEHKPHFFEVDLAKGIGILLVIIGHCFPDVSSSAGISIPLFRTVHDIIYTFHMPLMFMLAGFLAYKVIFLHSFTQRWQHIQKRFVRLIVPYLVIGLLYMPIKLVMSKYANQPYDLNSFWQIMFGENPDGGLWYLWALFVIQGILALVLTKKDLIISLFLSAVFSILIIFLNLSFYRVDDAFYYMFFVLLGIVIGLNYEKYEGKYNLIITIVLVLVFSIFVFFTLNRSVVGFKFICGILGSVSVLMISRQLIISFGENCICKTIEYIGKYSMDIYVLHGIVMVAIRIVFWSTLKVNYYLCTLTMLMGGLIIPIVISKYIIRKSSILTFLLLGEKSQKRQ